MPLDNPYPQSTLATDEPKRAASGVAGALDLAFHGLLQPLQVGIGELKEGIQHLLSSQADFHLRLDQLEKLVQAGLDEQEKDSSAQEAQAWETTILGEELCRSEQLAAGRSQLLEALRGGDANARQLTGQILLAASVSGQDLPRVMQAVGEALYRWQPKTSPGEVLMESGLAEWLNQRSLANGSGISVELVSPGERFDTQRHHAEGRGGARIATVHGWVVLRENGVYTRAKVTVT